MDRRRGHRHLWGRRPKITRLGAELAHHFGAVEADFRRFYGLRLRDVAFGPDALSVPELANLVEALYTYGGALAHAGDVAPYSFADDVAATGVELLAHLAGITGKAWLKDYEPPKLKLRRPWEPESSTRARMSTREELKSFLGGAGTVRVSRPRS